MMAVHGKGWNPHIVFSTDASGSWGCGAIWQTRWIQCPWLKEWESKSIALKELLPIVIACAVWGPSRAHQQIQVLCDNLAVIDILKSKCIKVKDIMHLLRCLHFFVAIHDIALRAVHIPGILNTAADAISRNNMQVLWQTVPAAEWIPDRVWGYAGPETARLDVGRLEAVAKELCRASLAPSSSKTYQSVQKIFTEFCLACGKTLLPASEQLLILFVADLADSVCFSTARTYLAAIRHMHIAQGYGDPLKGCLQLELVLKGLKRRRPRSQDGRLPITPFVLLGLSLF